jgi:hypothetical protein
MCFFNFSPFFSFFFLSLSCSSSSLWVSTLVPVEAYGFASLRVYEGTDSRPVVTFEPVASAAVQPLLSGGIWFNASGVQLLCQADICVPLQVPAGRHVLHGCLTGFSLLASVG